MSRKILIKQIIGSTAVSRAQTVQKEVKQSGTTELGNYQIQVVNSRLLPYIPGYIDEIVRKNRTENEIVYNKIN